MSGAGADMDYRSLGLKVGIELHRQLDVGSKLFCSCPPAKEEGTWSFRRVLMPSESELGEVDPAARFEAAKGMQILYSYGEASSCLVEADEEPPHDVSARALEAAVMISLMLNSHVVDEVHVMRKMVIDGSNTTGFQRTMLIGVGGALSVGGREVGVQTITLEEDAARIAGAEGRVKRFELDRLGVPLVEVSLAPMDVERSPQEAVEVASALGRLMKSTGMVARGIGTVRQDLNISIRGSGIVEVKGVQELPLIAKIVDFEAKRLYWLREVSGRLREMGIEGASAAGPVVDVTSTLSQVSGGFVKKALSGGARALAVLARGYSGLLGFEPFPDVRIGRDLASIAGLFGLGGVLHSDELPGYGITESMKSDVSNRLGASAQDAFVIVIGEPGVARRAIEAIADRLRELVAGPPSETRAPTPDGRTRYLRPRPGAARMYPETDLLPIEVTHEFVEGIRLRLPPPWGEQVRRLASKYGLSQKLADELLDSEMYQLFEEAVNSMGVKPSVAAVTLTETLVSLRRKGLDVDLIGEGGLRALLSMVAAGEVAKEAIPTVLEQVASGKASGVEDAARRLGLGGLSDEELSTIIADVIRRNQGLVLERGERALGPLMGDVMAVVRGRADGSRVSAILRRMLADALRRSG